MNTAKIKMIENYLEEKLSYFNVEKIKEDGHSIKIIMSEDLFDELKKKYKEEGTFLMYKQFMIFKRQCMSESVLIFLDEKKIDFYM